MRRSMVVLLCSLGCAGELGSEPDLPEAGATEGEDGDLALRPDGALPVTALDMPLPRECDGWQARPEAGAEYSIRFEVRHGEIVDGQAPSLPPGGVQCFTAMGRALMGKPYGDASFVVQLSRHATLEEQAAAEAAPMQPGAMVMIERVRGLIDDVREEARQCSTVSGAVVQVRVSLVGEPGEVTEVQVWPDQALVADDPELPAIRQCVEDLVLGRRIGPLPSSARRGAKFPLAVGPLRG